MTCDSAAGVICYRPRNNPRYAAMVETDTTAGELAIIERHARYSLTT